MKQAHLTLIACKIIKNKYICLEIIIINRCLKINVYMITRSFL